MICFLFAKVFISHKHNAIVNRHRQNALLTYKALVEAAGDTPNREVIFVQAAACIFNPKALVTAIRFPSLLIPIYSGVFKSSINRVTTLNCPFFNKS